MYIFSFKSGHLSCSVKKCAFKNFANFTGKHLCGVSSCKSQACNCVKKGITGFFSCEICEIFKNTYFEEYLRMTDCYTIFFLMVLITTYFFVQDQTEIDEEWVSQSPHRRLYFPQNNHFLY